VKESTCVACPSNTVKDDNSCKACSPGQYVNGNSCETCPTGTIVSATGNSCEKCPPGNYIENYNCKTCPEGTTVSPTGTSCDTCYTFLVNKYKCFSCAPGWKYIDRKCYNPGYFNSDGSPKIPIEKMTPGVKIQIKPAVRVSPIWN
jgi:hypothetical protein